MKRSALFRKYVGQKKKKSAGRGTTGSNAGKGEWATNGKGRGGSSISDVRHSACVSRAGALLPAPASDVPPSLICCELPPCCAQPLLQPG